MIGEDNTTTKIDNLTDSGKNSIGEHSRPLRFLIVTLVVAAWWAIGNFLFHTNVTQYTLLGVPILLAFQWWIHRQPLLSLWVRSHPPLQMDTWFFIFWFLFSLVPAYNVVVAVAQADWWNAVIAVAAIIGAFGLAYALRAMRSVNKRQMTLYLLLAVIIGLLPLIPTLILPQFLHMKISGQTVGAPLPNLLTIMQVGLGRFLFGTVGFVVEEVFFRGGLDTYLHRGEKGIGWFSAIYISALWGLWHLPGTALSEGHLLSTIVGLLVSQIILGVPLSLLWRKSGNLTVPDTTHALLQAVRSILAITT